MECEEEEEEVDCRTPFEFEFEDDSNSVAGFGCEDEDGKSPLAESVCGEGVYNSLSPIKKSMGSEGVGAWDEVSMREDWGGDDASRVAVRLRGSKGGMTSVESASATVLLDSIFSGCL